MGGIVTKNAFLPPSPYEIENEEGIVYVETKSKHKTPLLFFKSNDANKYVISVYTELIISQITFHHHFFTWKC